MSAHSKLATPPGGPASPVVHEHRWWTLFAMCFALFMIMLDNTVVNVALPSIQRALGAAPEALEWTVNAYILSFACLIMLGGKLGDRFGRKRMFVVGLALFVSASAACGLARTDTHLIVARAVQGAGGALLNPLSLSILVTAFPAAQLPTAIGVWSGISGLGLAVGPLAGGFLVESVGWSAVFWINVPIGMIAVVLTCWVVHESRDPTARKLDSAGAVLVTAGLFALVWGLIETNTKGWGSPDTLARLGAGIALLLAFVAWESRVCQPMLPLAFFRQRAFSVSSIVGAMVTFGVLGAIYFITLYLQNVQGYTPLGAGLRTLPLMAMLAIISPIGGWLNRRVGARALMTVGMFLAAGGLCGLSYLGVDTPYAFIWPSYVMLGTGASLTIPAVSATGMAAVPRDQSGIAAGVINASRQVGAALGIAVLGSIGAALTGDAWQSQLAKMPPGVQREAASLEALVEGAQGQAVAAAAGPAAAAAALQSFVYGVRGAMGAGALALLAAGLVAFVGLRDEIIAEEDIPRERTAGVEL